MAFFQGTRILLSNFNVTSFKNIIDYRGVEPQRCISYDQHLGMYQFSNFTLPRQSGVASDCVGISICGCRHFYCNGDQLFYSKDGNYVEAKDLKIGDLLIGIKSLSDPSHRYVVTSIDNAEVDMPVCKVIIPNYKNFALECGVFARA